MKPDGKALGLPALAALAFFLSFGSAHAVSASKDGITLVISCPKVIDDPGNTKIGFILQSDTDNVFYYSYGAFVNYDIVLTDEEGNRIPPVHEWELSHMRKSVDMDRFYDAHDIVLASIRGGTRTGFLHKSEKIDWSFILGDAFGERAKKGRRLTVTWHLAYNTSRQLADFTRMNQTNHGIPLVENKFPEGWSISATLDLPKWQGMPHDVDVAKPQNGKSDIGAGEAVPTSAAAHHTASVQPVAPTPSIANPWWWGLLAIPAILLAWLGLRPKKP